MAPTDRRRAAGGPGGGRHDAARPHTRATRHPAHPHPVFAPDGSAVLFNDLGEGGTLSITRVDLP
ncbi:hypothetical protein ACWEPL_64895 [Nonomuraea sp. NPDC004186]